MQDVEFVYSKSILNLEKYNSKIYASVNPYIGCSHLCKYCYVQAEKYSKANDISKVKIKQNAVEVLIKDISKYISRYPEGVIYLGTSCDPYQPVEEKFNLSQKILSILLQHTFYNIHIFTKSKLILRDIELFKKFSNRVNISITLITTDNKIKKIFEPNASSIEERIYCIKTLTSQGIKCGVAIMPILPYITDKDEVLSNLLYSVKTANCNYIWWDYLTLRNNLTDIKKLSQKQVYYNLLRVHFSDLIDKYNLLYKNKITPNINYKKIIDKKIINLSKKYNIPINGPCWEDFGPSYLFNY